MDKIIINILKKIEKSGFKAYVVGGYVRDYILGIETNDVDICTNARPIDIKEIFNLNKLSNDEYGNINIKTKKYNIDITTFRREKNYDKHSPKSIDYVDDVKIDLQRRDFTMNSILIDSKGNIIDYYDGVKDIKDKVIKCIGKTDFKLKEDPLRILRALRFSIIYNFKLDDEIKLFIKSNKHLIKNISYYRKKEELDKILFCKNKLEGLKILNDLKLDKELEISYKNIKYSSDILGMYTQIDFSSNYPFTKNEKDIINKVREILNNNVIDNNIIYKYGLYISSIAGEIIGYSYKDIYKMYKMLPIKSRKDIKISIESIVKLNNNCYNNINKIYLMLEKKILNGSLKNKSKDIIKFIRK